MKKWPIILILFFSGCAGSDPSLYPDDDNKRPIPIYVISHGWHVGIAIEASHIRDSLPEHSHIPDSKYLKFGWGDRRYYTDQNAGFWLMLRAGLLPTSSVIHVVGINRPVEKYFTSSTIIQIMITEDGAEQFGKFISDRFRRENGEVRFAADGLYRNSSFFEATGYYFFPKTSNTWTARALRKTGYPITPIYAITSGNVIRQAKKDGIIIHER